MERRPTTLGPPLERHGNLWLLDLTQLPLFHGLSVLSRALGELILDQASADRADIHVERRVHPRENPELLHHLGVVQVKVTAEYETVRPLVADPEAFQDNLRALFGTLQRRRYRRVLFPQGGGEPRALLFRFTRPVPATFLLERLRLPRNEGASALRISIDNPRRPRLALTAIPHVTVKDLEGRTFIAGSTRISQTWTEGLRREAERNRRLFLETKKPFSHTFKQFAKAGLGGIERVAVTWAETFVDRILESDPAELCHVLKKVLLALEDRGLRELLRAREVVRIVSHDVSVYLDLSELGRVLNLAIGQRRERVDVDAFLERMPALAAVAARPGRPLAGVRVFLVHHITAEVLGLIAALRRLGCRDLTTLFVAYAGEVPGSYLGALLDLPAEEFRCLGLTHVPEAERVEGHYRLSRRYSPLPGAGALDRALAARPRTFYEAMQLVGLAEFLALAARAEAAGEKVLLLEDGGYLAPLLNEAVRAGKRVREVAPLGSHDDRPLGELLGKVFLGSVEHTRNGMERLEAVASGGGLAFPAFTIAVSRLKRGLEAREVAATVLNAVENVLHTMGRLLSHRRCLVLGSRGAIGSRLMAALRTRLLDPPRQLWGVDLAAPPGARGEVLEVRRYGELPSWVRRSLDLVLGVTGVSVLQGADLESWLLAGEAAELLLASGSTKTEEFRDLAAWLDGVLAQEEPRVGGRPAAVEVEEVTDALTGRVYAHRYTFRIAGLPRPRRVTFLARMTPVNFLFYGVPREVIDRVLAELVRAGLGLLRRARRGDLPARLFAVDREITVDGDPLRAPLREPAGGLRSSPPPRGASTA